MVGLACGLYEGSRPPRLQIRPMKTAGVDIANYGEATQSPSRIMFFLRGRPRSWCHERNEATDGQPLARRLAESGRRGDFSPRLPHHRTCGSASGGSWQS